MPLGLFNFVAQSKLYMKYIFILASTLFSINAMIGQGTVPTMQFDVETYDLGPIKKGEKREFSYTFTNIGDENIEIDLVSGCDCTTLEWTRLPIKPGDQGSIDVIFDTTEKEDSDPVDIDIYLKNIDPKTGHPMLKILDYSFQLKM